MDRMSSITDMLGKSTIGVSLRCWRVCARMFGRLAREEMRFYIVDVFGVCIEYTRSSPLLQIYVSRLHIHLDYEQPNELIRRHIDAITYKRSNTNCVTLSSSNEWFYFFLYLICAALFSNIYSARCVFLSSSRS